MKIKDVDFLFPFIDKMARTIEKHLENNFSKTEIERIFNSAQKSFKNNISTIPDVGSDNPWLKSIMGVAYLSGLWVELEKFGLNIEEISKITRESLYDFTKSSVPADKSFETSRMLCSYEYADSLVKRSKKRIYKDDWIVELVTPKENEKFKIGYDVYQCPIIKYLKEHNLERFAKWFCLDDYPIHEAMGIKLDRTKTLAEGKDFCDFRLTPEK